MDIFKSSATQTQFGYHPSIARISPLRQQRYHPRSGYHCAADAIGCGCPALVIPSEAWESSRRRIFASLDSYVASFPQNDIWIYSNLPQPKHSLDIIVQNARYHHKVISSPQAISLLYLNSVALSCGLATLSCRHFRFLHFALMRCCN